MRSRLKLLLCWAVATAWLVCPLRLAVPADADNPPTAAADPANVLARLDQLEVMISCQWWQRARDAAAAVEGLFAANKTISEKSKSRLATAKAALAAHDQAVANDPEFKRRAELIDRVRKADPQFPQNPRAVRVRLEGGMDCRTIEDAFARAKTQPVDIIELHTGSYEVNPAWLQGPDNKNRPRVFYAPPGEWPRLTAPANAEFTFPSSQPVWLDGVELVAGSAGVAKSKVDVRNCYIRAGEPPVDVYKGATGLSSGGPAAANCVFEDFLTGLDGPAAGTVSHNLFMTCVLAVRFADEQAMLDRCAFYRCLTAVSGKSVKATSSVFARCKNLAGKDVALDQAGCVDDVEDTFANPFKGDFRLRGDVDRLRQLGSAGPDWAADRWEMFIANFDRPATQRPASLADARDRNAEAALAEMVKAYQNKEQPAAIAAALTPLLEKYADCPAVRKDDARRQIDAAARDVLAALAKEQPGSLDRQRQAAQDLIRQATTARDAKLLDDAVGYARRAVTTCPDFIDAHQLYAQLLLETGHPLKADPVIKKAAQLLAAAGPASAAAREAQRKLEEQARDLGKFAQAWTVLRQSQAEKYLSVAMQADGRAPSRILGLRRAILLTPDSKEDLRKRLDDAEKMLSGLTIKVDKRRDEGKAKADRDDSLKQARNGKYDDACVKRRNAYYLDPDPEAGDLLFLADTYQKHMLPKLASNAAVFCIQAWQDAAKIKDEARRAKNQKEALRILFEVDKHLRGLETLDKQFAEVLDDRRKLADDGGDKDTAAGITGVLDEVSRKFDPASIDLAKR